jgi:PiT family inorganic phosphate transporter
MAFSAIIYTYLRRLISRWRISSVSVFNRIALIIATFYTAYALGSNNIGLMLGVSQLPETTNAILVVGVLVGMVVMSSKFTKAIGEDFLVVGPLGVLASLISGSFVIWILTQFGYPASLTNGIIGGVIGIGIISKPKIFNVKKLYQITFSWFTAGVLGFITSYGVYILLLSYYVV